MAYEEKVATIFGGTGFVGRQIVKNLAQRGYTIKIATRIPESAYFLKPCGAVGQIVPITCNYSNPASVASAVQGADYVVNCIGILFERGKHSQFQRAHVDTPAMIARACFDGLVKKFVHISALGCDKGTSKYAKSKLTGEYAVLENFPNATILRPSVIFGEDDNFFNKFAELSRYLPFLPLIGGGKTKFQPVYIGDVAQSATKALLEPTDKYCGHIYELGGPEIINFKEIYELISKYTARQRPLINLPFSIAKIEAVFLGLLPNPLLTCDQVESLKTDNIVYGGARDFKDFNITPKSMDIILPTYLNRYKAGGRFGLAQSA